MKRILNLNPKRSINCYRNISRSTNKLYQKSVYQSQVEKNGIYEKIGGLTANFNLLSKINFCQTKTQICWSCEKSITCESPFLCDSCGVIQNVNKNVDYFKILSEEEKFNIDVTSLTRKFRNIQNVVHPDKYSNKSLKEQTNSQEWSSFINKAYKTLQAPIERGIYLLKLKGINMPQDNSSLNKEFLMEMMERNEEVEDATPNQLNDLLQKIKNDMIIEEKKLNKEFQANEYESAKFTLVKMKYFKSLEKSIKEKLENNL
ncbi:iron-sulfur cluster co-chaperone protein HscB isoform X2 [Condylostylus longicornis]|nr:iron-sulfur cluster co-chaperone protein HscB isoform X2 [Condylostylus longicornis]